MKPTFLKGDKVFAKVRGYPPWPSRVEGLADETPNKMKYHIYFYGTGETGIVKAEDMYPYVEAKAKYGKLKKPKNFLEAMNQIENELSPIELEKLSELQGNSSTLSTNTSINDSVNEDTGKGSTPKPGRPSVSGQSTSKKSFASGKDRKRKLDESANDDPDNKKVAMANNSDSESPNKAQEQLSRSGRKIRPKKFADEAVDEDGSAKPVTFNPPSKHDMSGLDEPVRVSAVINGEKIDIPLNVEKPTIESPDLIMEWRASLMELADSLKARLESGVITPEDVTDLVQDWNKEEIDRYKALVKLTLQGRTECRLLELDLGIRNALNIRDPDPDKCIELLNELHNLNLSALMLKKHPDPVSTIKKVRRYVGNAPAALTQEEEDEFHQKTAIIRTKAESVLSKFQSLFLIPDNKTFWDFFEEEKEAFYNRTKTLSAQEIVELTEDFTD